MHETKKGRREDIVATATQLFEARGYGKATVQDIVLEAGTCRATFYRYFAKKDDLLLAVVMPRAGRVVEHVLERTAKEADTMEKLWVAVDAALSAVAGDSLIANLLAENEARMAVRDVLYGTVQSLERAIVVMFRSAEREDGFVLEDVEATMAVFRLAMYAWFAEESQRDSPISLDRLSRAMEGLMRATARDSLGPRELRQKRDASLGATFG